MRRLPKCYSDEKIKASTPQGQNNATPLINHATTSLGTNTLLVCEASSGYNDTKKSRKIDLKCLRLGQVSYRVCAHTHTHTERTKLKMQHLPLGKRNSVQR